MGVREYLCGLLIAKLLFAFFDIQKKKMIIWCQKYKQSVFHKKQFVRSYMPHRPPEASHALFHRRWHVCICSSVGYVLLHLFQSKQVHFASLRWSFQFLVCALRSETISCISVNTKTNPARTEVCYIVQSFRLHRTDEIQSLRVCLSASMCIWPSQLSILQNLNNQHKSITILCRPSRTVAAVHVACPSCIVDTLYNGNESRATGRVVV